MTVMLIPCAGNIAIDMQAEFGPIPAALLPVGKDFALMATLKPVVDLYAKVMVGFSNPPAFVQNAVDRNYANVEIVDVGQTRSLGETIQRLLERLPPGTTNICIQMGDAFHPAVQRGFDTVYYSMEAAVNRWVSFEFDRSSGFHSIAMPGASTRSTLGTAFAGKFEISNPIEFAAELKTQLLAPSGKIDPFYRAIAKYFNSRPSEAELLIETKDWIDFGYSSSYFDYRRKVGFNSRSFNSLVFNDVKKSVVKRSENRAKLAEEINWYSQLPGDLADLYPRIYAQSDDKLNPWIETEYSVALPMDQLFMYSKLDATVWARIFTQLKFALERFSQHRSITGNVSLRKQLPAMCQSVYLRKTADRLAEIKNHPTFAAFKGNSVTVNSKPCLGLDAVIAQLPAVVTSFLEKYESIPSLIHGDLCFSNILYDHRLDHVRFIDPRGSFGVNGAAGDLRYDLAKLLHSASGSYDFLVNEHFEMSIENSDITLNILTREHSSPVTALCDSLVRHFVGDSGAGVRFIESLLFLSMIPLHADRAPVQQALLSVGLQQFTESLREMDLA